MKLHVKSQIVMYVNGRPSLHINLCIVFIYCTKQLNHHLYIPFIVMYKQLNIVPIYNNILYLCLVLMGLRVGVGWGRLGVCGSAVVPCMLWRLGGFGAVVFGNTAELGAHITLLMRAQILLYVYI